MFSSTLLPSGTIYSGSPLSNLALPRSLLSYSCCVLRPDRPRLWTWRVEALLTSPTLPLSTSAIVFLFPRSPRLILIIIPSRLTLANRVFLVHTFILNVTRAP